MHTTRICFVPLTIIIMQVVKEEAHEESLISLLQAFPQAEVYTTIEKVQRVIHANTKHHHSNTHHT